MRHRAGLAAATLIGSLAWAAAPAAANFHLMQIEQVVGGLCGDPGSQAIQLRMRALGQNVVSGHEIVAYDHNGENPVSLLVFPADAANGALGDRILLATAAFATDTGITPDFTLGQRIPDEYLRAGRVTFESSVGTILWSLAWGGSYWLGTNSGAVTNDADGDFGAPFIPRLPHSTAQSVLFTGAASAMSTTNAADYQQSAGPATMTNNAGQSTVLPACVFGDDFVLGDPFDWSEFSGVELCNSADDDGDTLIDEDFPLGQACLRPGPIVGTLVCGPDGRGTICV